MKFTVQALTLAVAASASSLTFAEAPSSEHSFSGNISVISSYNLRGLTNTPENSSATFQGGLDYNHASGFYAGWWGSTLDAAYGPFPAPENYDDTSFENDFYVGYNGAFNEDLGYTVGATYYYYYPAYSANNGFELLLGLNYKDFNFTAQPLLTDTTWGNKGDTYYKATYSYGLPGDVSLDTALGLYTYKKSGKYIEKEDTTKSFTFRHFDIGLSKVLGETGVTGSVNYIVGGYDRIDTKQKNKVVFGLAYSF